MVIFDYYKALKESDKCKIRDKFIYDSGLSRSTFYYKMRKGNWTKLELAYFKKIIKPIKKRQ